MDYTLLGVDGSLRPLAREILQRLVDDGHQLYIWSGNGIRWRDIRKHDLQSLVIDCIEKPVSDYVNAVAIMNVKPDLVVDDDLEIVAALGGVWARTYYFPFSINPSVGPPSQGGIADRFISIDISMNLAYPYL